MERLPQSLSVGADIIRPGCPVRNGGRMKIGRAHV